MKSRKQQLEDFAGYYIEETGYTAEDVEGCMIVRAASVVSDLTEDELAQAVREYEAAQKQPRR